MSFNFKCFNILAGNMAFNSFTRNSLNKKYQESMEVEGQIC